MMGNSSLAKWEGMKFNTLYLGRVMGYADICHFVLNACNETKVLDEYDLNDEYVVIYR